MIKNDETAIFNIKTYIYNKFWFKGERLFSLANSFFFSNNWPAGENVISGFDANSNLLHIFKKKIPICIYILINKAYCVF